MENKLNILFFHSGSSGHYLSMRICNYHGNKYSFFYNGNGEYGKGMTIDDIEYIEYSIYNNKLTQDIFSKCPIVDNNLFYTGHLEETIVDYVREKINNFNNLNYCGTLYGDKTYGLHTLFGMTKRHLNGHQEDFPSKDELFDYVTNWKVYHTPNPNIGEWINWDKIFYNVDNEYIKKVFSKYGCENIQFDENFLEYTVTSLKLLLEYFPQLKNHHVVLGFDNNILERVI